MKRMIFYLFFLVTVNRQLWPQTLSQDLDRASLYFDAQNYVHAAAEYNAIYTDALPAWDRGVLLYNIGTALLADGKYKMAISKYQEATLLDINHPLYRRNLTFNQALAFLMEAHAMHQDLKENPKASLENYADTLMLYRHTLKAVEGASKADCLLQLAEGAKGCTPSVIITGLRDEAKRQNSQLLIDLNAFAKTIKQEPLQGSPLDKAIQSLQLAYKLFLIQEPLDPTALESLKKEQASLEKLLTSTSTTIDDYKRAEMFLATAQETLKGKHPANARFFVETAHFYINKLAEALTPPPSKPEIVLENSIRRQELTFFLTTAVQQSLEDGSHIADGKTILSDILEVNLNAAMAFPTTVIAQEKEAFSPSNENACQCEPWDEVMPLFFNGYHNGEQAKAILSYESLHAENAHSIIVLLEKTLKDWKEALDILRSKQKSHNHPNSTQRNDEHQKSTGVKSEKNESFDTIIKFIQAMESDDRSQPAVVIFGGKGEDRPW